jgi:hypothetical protein
MTTPEKPDMGDVLVFMKEEHVESLINAAKNSSDAAVREMGVRTDQLTKMVDAWRSKENQSLDLEVLITDELQPLIDRADRGEPVTVDDLAKAKFSLMKTVRGC